ncbi:Dolichyl-phosphate-mannose-protein mannosyltransferase [Microlunatus soli]|uniref:Dolichyl-phosphate-mannose-protein mannosyltransferase n=1 Tax=Microlunatus soli TaxID=630515 RepID=A0A1H1ZUT6_9ACTN|nr:Dolichyl-phosphate-mannose-protein mannosyltransferase [Microlunatus soli]
MTVPRFAARFVLPLAAVVAVVQWVAGLRGGPYFDEAYMLSLGRHHLDWGFADQPPVTPLLAAAMDHLVPGSLPVLRIPAVLATAGAVAVAGLIARELGADRRAQLLTAGAQATALWVTMAGRWLTPYTVEPVQWLLLLWLLLRWVRVRDDRLLLLLGVVAGIAAETKFQVLLLCAVLLLSVLITGPRELLRRPLFWAGVGIAGVIALPTLIWQGRNGWPQLRMGPIAASESLLYGGRPGIAISLIGMAGVAGMVLLIYGLWRFFGDRELRTYRFLAVSFLALYVFFVITQGRPYYLNGLYGPVIAAGALGLQRRREARERDGLPPRRGWLIWPAYAVSVAAAIGMLILGTSMGSSRPGDQIARNAATGYQQIPAADRSRTVVMGQSYIYAAYLDNYGPRYGLPPAYSGNRGYGYSDPPPASADQVLLVGSDPDQLRPYFSSITVVVDGGQDGTSVWLCSGQRLAWTSLWPKLRTLTVG